MHIGGALAERAEHLPPHAGELLCKAEEDGARSRVRDVRMMRRIQLPSVALVVGVHAARPMVHTPPVAVKHPRLPVARGAEVVAGGYFKEAMTTNDKNETRTGQN